VLLFDLFRTILMFTPQAPTGQVRECTWRPAMRGLRTRALPLLGEIEFDFFLDALFDVSVAIAKARPPEYREVPIEERYTRALARLGCEGPAAAATASKLARLQLEAQAANTELPPAHGTVLRELARTRRLAVVSNFDHGPTAHTLLARYGLDEVLTTAVISIDAGRRKPHPEIFAEALRRLDATPDMALCIGDSLGDDVAGARAAGIDSVWVNWEGAPLPPEGPQPTFVVRALVDLRDILLEGAAPSAPGSGAG
jgi:putative hydrolase of the HAD superfamily